MSDLRNKIIRLAKENPELRSDLLPLLKKEAAPQFSIEAYRKNVLKEAGNFAKMNGKQRQQWKDTYASVLTLYNVTFDEEQKKRIENIMSDLKSNVLPFLNQEARDITLDMRAIARFSVGDVATTRALVKDLKHKRIRDAAMYYLENRLYM